MDVIDPIQIWKLAVILVFAGFLPLTAISYYRFRRFQRRDEIAHIEARLNLREKYQKRYLDQVKGSQFALAVTFATVLSCLGLTALMFGSELGVAEHPNLLLAGAHLPSAQAEMPDGLVRYQQRALLVFAMAFLGAFFWALQDIFRRYSVNCLMPSAYYDLSLRMILACIVSLLVYHAADALTGGVGAMVHDGGATAGPASDQANAGGAVGILPALAFLIGTFPQRALRWLQTRINIFGQTGDPSVRPLPLAMIEGLTMHDELQLGELGIDNCYDLDKADFIPLLLKTPYPARELIDWQLQAKLCVHFGPAVKELRERGLRTVVDLQQLPKKAIDGTVHELASQTSLTEAGLYRAIEVIRNDQEITKMCRAARRVGNYWLDEEAEASERVPKNAAQRSSQLAA